MSKTRSIIRRLTVWLLSLACLLSAGMMQAFAASEATASREYAISALVRAAELTGGSADDLAVFADADKIGAAYAADVASAVANGVVSGYGDGLLNPAAPITKTEALLLAARCLPDVTRFYYPTFFSDTPDWSSKEIGRLSRAGFIEGKNGDALGASKTLTTAEADELAERVKDRLLLEKIAAANRCDELMKRHSSIAQTVRFAFGDGRFDNYCFYSPDMTAAELENRKCVYYADRTLSRDPDTGTLRMDILLGTDNSLLIGEYMDYLTLDFSAERLIDKREENGLLTIRTLIDDADEVRPILERYELAYRAGDRFERTLVLDGQTLESREESSRLLHADGTAEDFDHAEIKYDSVYDTTPFAAYFNAERLRKLTLSYAPGTAYGVEKTIELPKAVPFAVWVENDWGSFFTDAACTQLYEGSAPDDYSDLQLYIGARLHTPTEADRAKIDELVAANSSEQIIARHGKKMFTFTRYKDCKPFFRCTDFLDAQSFLQESFLLNGIDSELHTSLYVSGELIAQTTDSCVVANLAPAEQRAEYLSTARRNISFSISKGEKPIAFGENESEYLLVSENRDPDAVREILEIMRTTSGAPFVYEDGMYLRFTAAFDKETLSIGSNDTRLYKADGTSELIQQEAYAYDVAYTAESFAFGAYLDLANAAPQRTVKVVWNAGAAGEESETFRVPQGVEILGLEDILYADPACTQPLDPETLLHGDGITVYGKTEN